MINDPLTYRGLTGAQYTALSRLSFSEPRSAYGCQATLPTLRALCKLGFARDVTKPGPGGMFSPRNHYQFIRIK